jgi:transcriptional regulator with XRE-family HTH domain
MEIEPDFSPKETHSVSNEAAKTPQRMKYEAEVRVFLNRHGSLENVRKNLGFSQRKICQMLLVDPSAWTRWHSAGGKAPPHVYRALEWYLVLEGRAELHPRIADLYARGTPATPDSSPISKAEVDELCAQVQRLRRLVWIGPAVSVLIALAWILR